MSGINYVDHILKQPTVWAFVARTVFCPGPEGKDSVAAVFSAAGKAAVREYFEARKGNGGAAMWWKRLKYVGIALLCCLGLGLRLFVDGYRITRDLGRLWEYLQSLWG